MARESGFTATADYGQIAQMDVVIICVPTPLERVPRTRPQLRHRTPSAASRRTFTTASSSSSKAPPIPAPPRKLWSRCSRRGIHPACASRADAASSGFYVAFSPEREDPGNDTVARRDIPKVVGGCGPAARDLASAVYASIFNRTVPVSSPAAAEMTKLLENIYRCVNIALVNELKQLCMRMGIDHLRSHRRRQDQALRLPGVLSRARPRRPLHSHRSVLSLLEGQGV